MYTNLANSDFYLELLCSSKTETPGRFKELIQRRGTLALTQVAQSFSLVLRIRQVYSLEIDFDGVSHFWNAENAF